MQIKNYKLAQRKKKAPSKTAQEHFADFRPLLTFDAEFKSQNCIKQRAKKKLAKKRRHNTVIKTL